MVALAGCLAVGVVACGGDGTTSATSPVSAQAWNATVARDSTQLGVAEQQTGHACSADKFADACAQAVTTLRDDSAVMLHDLYNMTAPARFAPAQAKFESALQKFQQAATDSLEAIHDRSSAELASASTEGLASDALLSQAGQLVSSTAP